MSMKTIVSGCLLSLALGSALIASPAMAQKSAKWFVLRDHQTGTCWTALLIWIDGDFRRASAQKAGGPYDSEAEALKREKDLETKGVCTKS